MEGTPTGDGRMIAADGLTWMSEPMPLRYVHSDSGQHDGAVTVGQILTVERQEGGVIFATGTLDDSFPEGAHAAKLIADGLQNGISIDPDDVTVEFQSPDGGEATEETDPASVVQVMTLARIRAATLVAIPAFAEAKIALIGGEDEEEDPEDPEAAGGRRQKERRLAVEKLRALVAAAPVAPPEAWFANPQFDGPTKVRVDGDRVYGHIATWGTCHIGFGDNRCIQPPVSHARYAYFATGTLLTAEGTEVHVGSITVDAPHAGRRLRASAAAAHYDNTGTVAADVAIGEDEYGIWVAGALRPGTTEEQVRTLRAAALSGDWRKLSGHLELVGLLAVNVPGFPIVETHLAASGCPESLVATGLVFAADTPSEPPARGILAGANAIASRIGRDPESRRKALAARVHG